MSNNINNPDLLTEEEVVRFLRIPEVSKATNYSNVVKNLIRFRDLPRIQIGKRLLFPKQAVLEWVNNQTRRD
jgi:predicted DNA-binding transcriptional regulator AlpA